MMIPFAKPNADCVHSHPSLLFSKGIKGKSQLKFCSKYCRMARSNSWVVGEACSVLIGKG